MQSDANCGCSRRSPASSCCWNSKEYVKCENGACPNVNISHTVTPKAHMSDDGENSMYFNDSGAIHRQGKDAWIK